MVWGEERKKGVEENRVQLRPYKPGTHGPVKDSNIPNAEYNIPEAEGTRILGRHKMI